MTIPEVRPYTQPYKPSGGLWFDGQTGYVDCGDNSSLDDITADITIIASVKLNQLNVLQNIVSMKNSATQKAGYSVSIKGATNQIQFTLGNGTDWLTAGISTGKAMDANTEFWAAGVYDGSTARVYYNGSAYGRTINITPPITRSTYPGRTNKIGVWSDALGGFLGGVLYQIIIIAEALTQSEIRGLMEGRRLPTEWDCRLWLDFRQGHTRDLSGNGNHGTLYGGAYFV